MNKTLRPKSKGARWLILGGLAILGIAALFYASPPIPGRAFTKNFVTPTNHGATDHRVTPDDLLW